MSNLSLVAIKAHRYAGKLRGPGDSYEARTAQDARLMKALKWAIDGQLVTPIVAVPVPVPVAVPSAVADGDEPPAAPVKRGRKPRAAAVPSAMPPELPLAALAVEPQGDASPLKDDGPGEACAVTLPDPVDSEDSADADGIE